VQNQFYTTGKNPASLGIRMSMTTTTLMEATALVIGGIKRSTIIGGIEMVEDLIATMEEMP